MSLLFSIIIPVYNSERYLEQCVNSILAQSYQNVQIILIDDGSTDNSGALCDALAARSVRIMALHKQNGGTSAARNYGMRHAAGDYIMFMDNDDFWFQDDALEAVAKQLEESKADVLVYNSVIYHDDTGCYDNCPVHLKRSDVYGKAQCEALLRLLESGAFSVTVWTKAIKRSLLEENNIRFPEHMRNEDTDFSAKLIPHASVYDYFETPFHAYRKGHDSAQTSKQVSRASLDDLAAILRSHYNAAAKLENPGLQHAYYSFLAYPFAVWMGQSCFFPEKRNLQREMTDLVTILEHGSMPIMCHIRRIYHLVGYYNTCKILSSYFRFHYGYR